MDVNRSRLKQLDLLGGLGAGVLGAGLALLFADFLKPLALPALGIGLLAHGYAMFSKSRLERQASLAQPGWAVATERICWILLVALAAFIMVEFIQL